MSDGYTTYSKDEFIAKFGYDPDAVGEPVAATGGSPIANHLKSAAVGVMTVPTDILNFPSTVYKGAGALYDAYANDTKFVDEFQKRIQVEGAKDNVQKHLQDVVTSWRERDPSLTPEQLEAGIAEYQKTKQFEDFTTEQLSGTQYLASKWRDTSRRLLGDERTEDQRSWTESAGEVLGGALVGGPAGWVGRLSTVPRLAGVVANPVARGAIRTAEALTPLTIPYSGTNVAVNAAAGIGIDQAVRYAQGKSTAFTPTDEDSAGVASLAGTSAVVAGAAAFVAAVRGRTRQALQQSQTELALQANPQLNYRVELDPQTGQSFIRGGAPQQLGPSSELEETANRSLFGRVQGWRRSARDRLIDQAAHPNAMIRDIHGGEVAREAENLYTRNTGAVLTDRIASDTITIDGPVRDAWAAMTPEKQRAVANAHWMTSYGSDILTTMDDLRTRIANLQTQITNPRTQQSSINALQNQVAELQTSLRRLTNDDPDARMRVPTVSQNTVFSTRNTFLADTDPQVMAYKNAVRNRNRILLDMQVASGRLSRATADEWHLRNPYYVQAVNDPYNNLTGWARTLAKWRGSVRAAQTRASEGSAAGTLREGPLRSLDKNPAQPQSIGAPETRITHPMEPMSASQEYTIRTLREVAHTLPRNEYIRLLTQDPNGNPSALVIDGRIRGVQSGVGRYWFTPEQLNSPTFRHLKDRTDVAIEWQNGQARVWEFGDPEVTRALRMEPVQLSGLMKTLTAITNNFKLFTTGKGNPAFPPVNGYYNTAIAMLTHRADRAFGPLSYASHRFLPERAARALSVIPDVTSIGMMPYYAVKNLIQLQTHFLTRPLARQLAQNVVPFQALQSVVGQRMFNSMVNVASRVALWADQAPAVVLRRGGAGHGVQSIDHIPRIRDSFSSTRERVPAPLRYAWQFYTDVLDSFHLSDKAQYFTQNHALLSRRHGGNIPQRDLERLIDETRNISGDMSLVPASKLMQDVERVVPYMTQTKLGAYHLARNMFGRDTAQFVIPRMMIAMYAVGQSYYFMTHWNDESRKKLWQDTPEYDRYRFVYIPTPQLLMAWGRGENPAYSDDLVYKVRIPPDIAGIVAGTTAFMQMIGAIPADATIKPLIGDVPKVWADSLTPAMPPLLQLFLAQSGKRLDPGTSETRGGAWIRDSGSLFRSGPNAESVSNLGEVSNSTSLMMGALFGAMGTHIAMATDVMLHAAKYNTTGGPTPLPTPRQSADYAAGLQKATGEVFNRVKSRIPEVPLVWQNQERYAVMTPAWQVMSQNTSHIRSINGMRDDLGKAATARRQAAVEAGGIPQRVMTDQVLIQIAEDISAWQRSTGDLGKLKQQQNDLRVRSRAVDVQYNLSFEQRTAEKNKYIKMQQDNMEQQRLATQYAEQVIAAKYGQALAPMLKGRQINMATLDAMMRENVGGAAVPPQVEAQPEQ